MYESHFGLTGSPFALNPDPAFYFDSKGHANALAYLKFGVYQGEGFIVVTGDIGAGKTTLVRTLLADLDSDKIVAAQVVSTQLESAELLFSIATAFGVPVQGTGKAQLLATLEAFLTATAARGRRALLIVDEAQNLNLQAIEELRMLSNFQLGSHSLLQSFLVGQPELRKLLESKALEQLRQRVTASCHLGPLGRDETQAYIEHRLRKAGWANVPSFEDGAFHAIHQWAGGVPRRINLLCNRLFLACYLAGEEVISNRLVDQVAREMRGEVGEMPGGPSAPVTPVSAPAANEPHLAARDDTVPAPPVPGAAAPAHQGPLYVNPQIQAAPDTVKVERASQANLAGALMVIGETAATVRKAGAIAHVFSAQGGSLPAVVLANPGRPEDVAMSDDDRRWLAMPDAQYHLGIEPTGFAPTSAAQLLAFDGLFQELQPCAVLAIGNGDGVLAGALAARKRGIRLLRIEAGQRLSDGDEAGDLNALLVERMADVLFTSKLTAHYTLYREGIATEKVQCVGTLVSDVLQQALRSSIDTNVVMSRLNLPGTLTRSPRGYGLVTIQSGRGQLRLANVLTMLSALGAETPLVWQCDAMTRAELDQMGVERMLADAHIVVVDKLGYLETLALLVGATYLVTGPQRAMLEESVAMGIPCMTVAHGVTVPTKQDDGWNTVVGCDSEQALRVAKEILALGVRFRDVKKPLEAETALRLSHHVRNWLSRGRAEAARRPA
jgi:UDP-N-acetylglucosamine 2-epimerase